MIRARRRLGRWLIALAVFALVVLLRAGGFLQPLEFAAIDARARLLEHEVASDIVIVGIDARSLAALDQWPWPRRHHARLLDALAAREPRSVFLDIDFSSHSNPLDDAVLEAALVRWDDRRVLLPAFFQTATPADAGLMLTRPLERFARHATLVAVNRLPGADGLERVWRSSWSHGARALPSVIDTETRLAPNSVVPIDYSISPGSFAYLSYLDLIEGRVAAGALAGKTVYVGATAVELGDMVAVPVYQSLPGVVVQALATESVRAGVLHAPGTLAMFSALAVWTLLCAWLLDTRSWRRNLVSLAAGLLTLSAAALLAYSSIRWLVEVVPFALTIGGVFLAATLRSLDVQTWRAIAYALGMKRRDALLKSIVQSSTDSIVCVDANGLIKTANPAAAQLFACPVHEIVDTPIARYIPALITSQSLAGLHGAIFECEAHALDGRWFPVEISTSRVRLNTERLYTAIVRDISERKAQQRRLEHQATHDSLTSLPNRAALMTRLEASLSGVNPGNDIACMMLDLSRFKEVNDTLGHDVGDSVLCEVARRFRETLGERGFIARIGGDEFTVVLDGIENEASVAATAERLAESLRAPIDVAGISIEVGLSIGIARFPHDASDAAALLRHADVAMYVAKRRASPYEFYDAEHDENTVRKLAMGGELRTAIAGGQLELYYQPQVNLSTGRVESAEALLRWMHPTLGQISPDEFIAIAETTDLIRPLTEWTIGEALRQAAEWRSRGVNLRIAVNLSARLLQDTAFPGRLRGQLDAAGASPRSFELEITESAMMLDPARALRVIQDIDRLGVLIAIDDFGTGYSSLGYLRDLPAHSLKLDKSFVTQMRTRADDRVIVESTARMAHALGLELVAEGVESEWDAQFLASAGYQYAQGYLYSRALPAERCFEWIREFNRAAEPVRLHG